MWLEVRDVFLEQIDWQRPWLTSVLPAAMPIVRGHDWRCALNDAARALNLLNHRGLPVRFVMQSELPPGIAYETFISVTGNVPTRDNSHDFFNALVWLTFPQIKAQLNALQASAIAQASDSGECIGTARFHRGKLRDAATIFDENAALLVTSNENLTEALRQHRWHDAFVENRAVFERDCEVWLFGHALMEKLIAPYKAITAHAWITVTDKTFFSLPPQNRRMWIDVEVTRRIAGGLMTSDFTPLPVLGVPDWWPGQDATFYADAAVFRPRRK